MLVFYTDIQLFMEALTVRESNPPTSQECAELYVIYLQELRWANERHNRITMCVICVFVRVIFMLFYTH